MTDDIDGVIAGKVNMIRALASQGKVEFAQFESAKLVAQYPNNVMALCVMSYTFYAANELKNSLRYAHLAYSKISKSSSWKDVLSASNALLMIGETQEAVSVLENLDMAEMTDVNDLSYIARHYGNLDLIEQAVNTFDRISLEPMDFHSRQMYGVGLLYLGKFKEAQAEFEKAIELNPRDGVSYNQLSALKIPEARVERIEKTEEALKDQSLDPVNKSYMHFSLFNEYDANDDLGKAWKHLQLANSVRRASIYHDVSHDITGCKNIIDLYNRLPSRITDVDSQEITPIFIVGLPRTGTTLLEKMLSSFDDVKPCGELRTFRRELELGVNCNFLNAFGFGFCDGAEALDYTYIGREYIRKNRWRLDTHKFMVDKEPSNFIYAGFIARALPNARIIHIKRNPMDACFSNYKQFFAQSSFTYSYDFSDLANHYKLYTQLTRFWKERIGGNLLELHYESLVNDPEGHAKKIRDFCGLKSASDIHAQNDKYVTSTLSAAQVRAPIHKGNINSWRKYEVPLRPLYEKLEAYILKYDAELTK